MTQSVLIKTLQDLFIMLAKNQGPEQREKLTPKRQRRCPMRQLLPKKGPANGAQAQRDSI
ncbi:hypothetical protein HBA55_30330 [Pseudomaricurvus alkylphenolicus]|jgi:hypothetical protein|uniref:hypothetical protein n=1 Tax=Pseudomaricurvus alkylphenolicus TaxID=1306991 RepID=UPI001420CD66|nr:hypothetical protein [Pseudomaricurvus alkylphenolicus]NIB43938.1 hypothetical protein [Pseudomaricurvus alkylphenolicus]